jgi:hypothetical protein
MPSGVVGTPRTVDARPRVARTAARAEAEPRAGIVRVERLAEARDPLRDCASAASGSVNGATVAAATSATERSEGVRDDLRGRAGRMEWTNRMKEIYTPTGARARREGRS